MASANPVVGNWYRRSDGVSCEIVAIDRDDGTIEVQHFDGTVEEFDLESWDEQEFEAGYPPEDWIASVDVEPEDFDNDREVSAASQWIDPLTSLDRSEASGYSEWPAHGDM
ncbi:hypothetical protein ACG33_13830 [Steroidobacter denitrificans]|uniref:Uncharacterized protein n=1 Tax=Steroidobacter denitrificans TaxID=465721 RepID=A0A127FCN6_STEDE|nr:DUF6763 family protein [Steroidobacter denitrificans]AMN48157.1 hypothetical protein ACG33_13830 [Steroidobacter denitrificans]